MAETRFKKIAKLTQKNEKKVNSSIVAMDMLDSLSFYKNEKHGMSFIIRRRDVYLQSDNKPEINGKRLSASRKPDFITKDSPLFSFFKRRYDLFERYDEG